MILIMGFAAFFNLAVIKLKFESERTADAWADLAILILLGWVMGGSEAGLAMASVASAMFSIFLYFSPPKLDWLDDETENP